MKYIIKIFLTLSICFSISNLSAQKLVINKKNIDIKQRGVIPVNLKAGSTLEISLKKLGATKAQVGPFTGTDNDSIEVTYKTKQGDVKVTIHRYEHPTIPSQTFKIKVNSDIEQIILEMFGGANNYYVKLVAE
jgi:hypothetical protein